MHRATVVARLVLHLHVRGIRQERLFDDRQAIQIGAEHHCRPRSIFQDRNDSVPADIRRHSKSRLLPFLGQSGGRFLFKQ